MFKFWSGGTDMGNEDFNGILSINSVTNESGLIMIDGTIPKINATRFRVSFVNEARFILVYEEKSTIYNLVVSL